MKRSIKRQLVAGLALLTLSGCGAGDWHAETYPTRGTLRINQQPAAGALVHFHAADDPVDKRHSTPWAKVGPDGGFEVSTYGDGDGAPEGRYDITLVWPVDASKPSTFDQLDRQFDQPSESQWTVTVSEGTNELPAIELEGIRLSEPGSRRAQPTLQP